MKQVASTFSLQKWLTCSRIQKERGGTRKGTESNIQGLNKWFKKNGTRQRGDGYKNISDVYGPAKRDKKYDTPKAFQNICISVIKKQETTQCQKVE